MTWLIDLINRYPEFMVSMGVYVFGLLLISLAAAAYKDALRHHYYKLGNDMVLMGFGFLGAAAISQRTVFNPSNPANPVVAFAAYALVLFVLYVASIKSYQYISTMRYAEGENVRVRLFWLFCFGISQCSGLAAIAITWDLIGSKGN